MWHAALPVLLAAAGDVWTAPSDVWNVDGSFSSFGAGSFGAASFSSFGSYMGEAQPVGRHIRPCFGNCAGMPAIEADESDWCDFVAPLSTSTSCLNDCEGIDFLILDDFQESCSGAGSGSGSFKSSFESSSEGSFVSSLEVGSFQAVLSLASSRQEAQSSPRGSLVRLASIVSAGAIAVVLMAWAAYKRRSSQHQEHAVGDKLLDAYPPAQVGEIML